MIGGSDLVAPALLNLWELASDIEKYFWWMSLRLNSVKKMDALFPMVIANRFFDILKLIGGIFNL
jgi:hypothetical protein